MESDTVTNYRAPACSPLLVMCGGRGGGSQAAGAGVKLMC